MTTIREFKLKDLSQLKSLAKQHNLVLPPNGMVNVAEDSGQIIGMMLIRLVPTIEPFICTNPLVAKKLYDTTIKQVETVMSDLNIIRCYVKPEHFNLYSKLGFYKVFEKQIIMERNLHNDI